MAASVRFEITFITWTSNSPNRLSLQDGLFSSVNPAILTIAHNGNVRN